MLPSCVQLTHTRGFFNVEAYVAAKPTVAWKRGWSVPAPNLLKPSYDTHERFKLGSTVVVPPPFAPKTVAGLRSAPAMPIAASRVRPVFSPNTGDTSRA